MIIYYIHAEEKTVIQKQNVLATIKYYAYDITR